MTEFSMAKINYATIFRPAYEIQAPYSQSTSRVTSISKNEMNIQSLLCNVQHLNGMLHISLEIFPKRCINWQKDSKYLGNNNNYCYS